MNSAELRKAYKTFFVESLAGQHFMKQIEELISSNHQDAEDNPERSRDYTQRAKGKREIIAHINSLTAEPNKGRRLHTP